MTTYTWTRGRSGASTGSGTDTLIQVPLATYNPGAALTVRRIICDWSYDLGAPAEADGAVNGRAPLSVGIIYAFNSAGPPSPPGFGPASVPDYPWTWWGGASYGAQYGISSDLSSPLIMQAHGRIDRQSAFKISSLDMYISFWLCFELQDPGVGWTSKIGIAWWQFLTAPTVG